MHSEFPYIAFISAFLVLVPFPWHWRAGNVATISMMLWLFAVNVIYGVDSIVWGNNVRVTLITWCDITTKVLIGANIALPAACMCVCIHLERVASVRHVKTSLADKRRRQLIEGLICFVLPAIWMAVHYVVQGHRFDIIEEYGCRPSIYTSIPAIFLIWVPPLGMSVVTLIFAGLALRHFLRRRVTFAKHLETRSGLTTSRYMRLMLMAVIEMIIGVASTSTTLWTATLDIRTWTNWSDVHWNFSRIDQYPSVYVPAFTKRYYYAIWCIIPFSSLVFFVFFAFGQEAVREYGACISWLRQRLFKLRVREQEGHKALGTAIPSPSLPIFKPSAQTQQTSLSTMSFGSTTPQFMIKDKALFASPSDEAELHVIHLSPPNSASALITAEERDLPPTPSTASSSLTLSSPLRH